MDHISGPIETNKLYWKSPDELHGGKNELRVLSNKSQDEGTRRDFLSLMGFSLAALGLTGCNRAPVQKAIPLVAGSSEMTPGVPVHYATTCGGCSSSCSLLVKTRDGRPIKIEGNPDSSVFGGGTCAAGQATVLSLYDSERLRGPLWNGNKATWEEVDKRVSSGLSSASAQGRKIVLLSGTVTSPATRDVISKWRAQYPNFRHVTYDAITLSALRQAHAQCYGKAAVPHYRFDKAKVIVGLDADFLGTWLSPVEFARQYSMVRRPDSGQPMSRHIQFEPGFSVTGSSADLRIPVSPSGLGAVAVSLLKHIADRAGMPGGPEVTAPLQKPEVVAAVAEELWRNKGRSLVVSGVNDPMVQVAVAALNSFLGNVGETIDLSLPSLQRTGDDAEATALVDEMERGEVGALIFYNANPVYNHPQSERFLQAMGKVGLTVSLADRPDETSVHAHAVCPDHHFLEAWGDAEPVTSQFSLAQPTISPLFDTRAAQESLLQWAGAPSDYYTYLREFWRREMFPRQTKTASFDTFWDDSLQRGTTELPQKERASVEAFHGDWKGAAQSIADAHRRTLASRSDDHYDIHLYESVAMRDGQHANNPWLQELPDPVSKVTWGNFAAIAPSLASKLGLREGDVVRLKSDTAQLEVPVFIQPGQEQRTISVALGYGRKQVGKVGRGVGVNAFPMAATGQEMRRYVTNVALEKTGRREDLAATQTHFSLDGRPIIKEVAANGSSHGEEAEARGQMPSLWTERPTSDHTWGMIIDLNACNGCSACVIACQAENNVAVVGKDQIQRTREMHWIRIDHYYSGPEEAPTSVHQPMMCQHCGHAPCETVCPVLATTHSSDGLNQQAYNRCIGTRYCANNCPYKVRRFNWLQYAGNGKFDYTMEDSLERMVLNPDVTVRSRGVMEKCSLCIQRIQAAKNLALQQGHPVLDGEIQTACQQVCPAQAIVFGDLQDPQSRASRLRADHRYYHVLEELGTQPNVGYLAKVRQTLIT